MCYTTTTAKKKSFKTWQDKSENIWTVWICRCGILLLYQFYIGESNKIILVVSTNVRLILSLYLPLSTNNICRFNSLKIHWINSSNILLLKCKQGEKVMSPIFMLLNTRDRTHASQSLAEYKYVCLTASSTVLWKTKLQNSTQCNKDYKPFCTCAQ